jgi:hypothetical protein
MDGKYFLIKLYTMEGFESLNQLLNMITLYTCSLPVGVTVAMGVMLGIDAFHTVFVMSKGNDPLRRNRQVNVDLLVDFTCIALPLMLMRFGYGVSISIMEMLRIVAIPVLCTILKIDDVFEEIVRYRSEMLEVRRSSNTRRRSQMREFQMFSMAETQDKMVPRWLRTFLKTLKMGFGLNFILISVVQLAMHAQVDCDDDLWQHCELKVPFCGRLFDPICDCAVLNVRRHNWTTLPDGVGDMKSLKTVKVNHGPLQHIPSFGAYTKVTEFDFSYNRLSAIPTQFEMPNVMILKMANNNVPSVPKTVWELKDLLWLELDNNNISTLSSEVKHAMQLEALYVSNNSLRHLPSALGGMNRLVDFFVDGNNLTVIPLSLFNTVSLRNLRFHNNRIRAIPPEIGQLTRLKALDIRYNFVGALPDDLVSLKELKYVYLHGNPICTNRWLDSNSDVKAFVASVEGGCNAQCSRYCQDRILKYVQCGRECNSKACDFQNGACLRR